MVKLVLLKNSLAVWIQSAYESLSENRNENLYNSVFLFKFGDIGNSIAGRPKAALLFWFFMIVLLSICLWYVSIVATFIAVHFAVCHALYNNKNKKIGNNRCLVFLNNLVMFCSVILSL